MKFPKAFVCVSINVPELAVAGVPKLIQPGWEDSFILCLIDGIGTDVPNHLKVSAFLAAAFTDATDVAFKLMSSRPKNSGSS